MIGDPTLSTMLAGRHRAGVSSYLPTYLLTYLLMLAGRHRAGVSSFLPTYLLTYLLMLAGRHRAGGSRPRLRRFDTLLGH